MCWSSVNERGIGSLVEVGLGLDEVGLDERGLVELGLDEAAAPASPLLPRITTTAAIPPPTMISDPTMSPSSSGRLLFFGGVDGPYAPGFVGPYGFVGP